MVISFYLLLICTDYFPYKLELHFYWLLVSFFIVTALKMFQNQILLRLWFEVLFVGLQESTSSTRRLFLRRAESPAKPCCSPFESWWPQLLALCKLTSKALPFVSVQESLCIKCFVCAHMHNEVMIWSMPTEPMFQLCALLWLLRQALLVGAHTSVWFIGSFYLYAHISYHNLGFSTYRLVNSRAYLPKHHCCYFPTEIQMGLKSFRPLMSFQHYLGLQ